MKRLVVVGVGNRVMRDDGIGVHVAEALGSTLRQRGMTVLPVETDVLYCLEELRQEDLVVVLDAEVRGGEPGALRVLTLEEARRSRISPRAQHEADLLDAIPLYFPGMGGFFIGIEAAEIGFGLKLSSQLKRRFARICAEVLAEILKIQQSTTP